MITILSLNVVATHPTENSIGQIWNDAKGLRTADRAFKSSSSTLDNKKITQSQRFKYQTRTRTDIGGPKFSPKNGQNQSL